MSKTRDTSTSQHHYDFAHYGELPVSALPAGAETDVFYFISGSWTTAQIGSIPTATGPFVFVTSEWELNPTLGIPALFGAGGNSYVWLDPTNYVELGDGVNIFYMDGVKHVASGGAGLVLPLRATDPSGGDSENGQAYYNSATHKFRGRVSGSWTDLGSGGVGTDEKVKVSSNDTTAGYLLEKIVAGTNVTLFENNDGGNESLTIQVVSGSGTDAGTLVGCRLQLVAQSIDNNTSTNVAFGSGSEAWDTHSFHDVTTNNSRITIPAGQGGKYALSASLNWAHDPDGMRRGIFLKNGAGFSPAAISSLMAIPTAGVGTGQLMYHEVELVADDYIELQVLHVAGSALTCDITLTVHKLLGGGGVAGAVMQSKAIRANGGTVVNPENAAETAVPDLGTISVTLDATRTVVVRYIGQVVKGTDGDKVKFHCYRDGTKVPAPDNGWYSQSVVEGSRQQVVGQWIDKDRVAGTYVYSIKSNAALGTSSSTYQEQSLTVEVIDETALGNAASGSAFPISPLTNERFYRTDHRLEFFYDGTRWLTTSVYTLPLTTRATFSITATTTVANMPARQDFDMFIERFEGPHFVSGGTALDASNKWVTTLNKIDATNGKTTIATLTVDSGTLSNWLPKSATPLVVVTTASKAFEIVCTKTGTPGTLFAAFEATYRLIGT